MLIIVKVLEVKIAQKYMCLLSIQILAFKNSKTVSLYYNLYSILVSENVINIVSYSK